jgi:hypothetical protein
MPLYHANVSLCLVGLDEVMKKAIREKAIFNKNWA